MSYTMRQLRQPLLGELHTAHPIKKPKKLKNSQNSCPSAGHRYHAVLFGAPAHAPSPSPSRWPGHPPPRLQQASHGAAQRPSRPSRPHPPPRSLCTGSHDACTPAAVNTMRCPTPPQNTGTSHSLPAALSAGAACICAPCYVSVYLEVTCRVGRALRQCCRPHQAEPPPHPLRSQTATGHPPMPPGSHRAPSHPAACECRSPRARGGAPAPRAALRQRAR